ncbi:zinc finger, AN1-type domain [Lobosporangium transversale]|uniref:AN1-type domain-containing protein n=1 Tax=Lobosporangium transversale TaxID=64571 RepID=A0A1Y2GBZ1_9FUNG|nr:hypothetical protein BCR41DRAFT_361800 [Lobosporangium transversale]KAF9899782.1 zinc finger, AN1-type domain [Lobosporangium transversale]ORZ05569.1 hypothetical protein BCR41DRAFT_361800 [Lobosporangium transversale]|eukprot:XP_021877143.1 hypothetical protein BCR41DRAFT_361800 [Lobosporangium transversale]
MELPSIGKHCSDLNCAQLDFLPFTCQYCKQIFCQDHWKLETHTCPNKDAATQQDQRVPICPLCDKPVPIKKGEDPNVRMEQHISAGCPEPATTTSKPIYTNSCNAKGCKNRSAIPIICQKCRRNFCLKHRLEDDHACPNLRQPQEPQMQQSSKKTSINPTRNARAAAAAESRASAGNGGQRSFASSGKKDKDKCLVS